jgi:hypothetical protein
MATDPRRIVRDWLEAEHAGQVEEADRRFRRVAASLPRYQPPAWFTETALARAGVTPPVRVVWAGWWVRWAAALALLSAAVLMAALPDDLWLTAVLTSVRSVASGLEHTAIGVHAWVGSALTVWAGLARAGLAVGRLLASPGPVLLLALNLTVAVAALVALRRLMPVQEN